jgi:WD40 repeat protein/serine/threonine protein kinase
MGKPGREPTDPAAARNGGSPAARLAPPVWKPGDIISGLYEVQQVHTGGAMGLVYRVRHLGWDIDLAVKVPRGELLHEERAKALVEREAETWVRLGLHPHVVSCYYVRRLHSLPHVFAEYVEGGSLSDWVRSRRLYAGGPVRALGNILDLAIQFAWGLHYAHSQGLIHQDVKPGNALLNAEGTLKVNDFGLARALDAAEKRSGGDGMTPAYCSPEQARRTTVTAKADMWGWGLCLLEMFLGERTWSYGFVAAEALTGYAETFDGHGLIPTMPTEVADLLKRIFSEDPAERPADMFVVAEELRRLYPRATGREYPRPNPKQSDVMPDALNNRAASLIDLGKPDDAFAAWSEAIRQDSLHLEATFNLNLLRWRRGELSRDQLTDRLKQAYVAHQGEWRAGYMLAFVHLELDDCTAAVRTLRQIAAEDSRPEVSQLRARIEQYLEGYRSPVQVLPGHETAVRCIALNPEGALAASGSWDQSVRLWDVAGGRCVHVFGGHRDVVTAVCFRGDKQILSAGADATVRLWDVTTGRCLWTTRHEDQVLALACTGDGRRVFSAGRDAIVRRWKAETGEATGEWEGHRGIITGLALSPDEEMLASCGTTRPLSRERSDAIHLWDVRTGRCRARWLADSGVTCLAFGPDGDILITGHLDGKLRIWDVRRGSVIAELDTKAGPVRRVSFINSKLLATGSEEGVLGIWDLSAGHCLRELRDHPGPIQALAAHPDGEHILTGSGDGSIRCWRPYSVRAPLFLCRMLDGERARRGKEQFRRCLREAASAIEAGTPSAAARSLREARTVPGYSRHPAALALWEDLYLRLGRSTLNGVWEERSLNGHDGGATALSCSADGNWLAAGCRSGPLLVWAVDGGWCAGAFEGHSGPVRSVWISPDASRMLSAGEDGTARYWDRQKSRCLLVLSGHRGPVRGVTAPLDGRFALTASLDGTVKFWQLPEGRCIRTLKAHAGGVQWVSLSTDELWLLTSGRDRCLRVWNVVTGECVRQFDRQSHQPRAVALAHDRSFAICGSNGGVISRWDIRTERRAGTLEGHTGRVPAVALSPDARYAVSGGFDETVRLWRLQGGRCMQVLEGHKGAVNAVGISPDVRYAFSGSDDGSVKVWALDWELENNPIADWHESAAPIVRAFLRRHMTPGPAPSRLLPSRRAVEGFLRRSGQSNWTPDDFRALMRELSCAGLGWLTPEGVERRLTQMEERQSHGEG